jgi:hypothetical protein
MFAKGNELDQIGDSINFHAVLSFSILITATTT